MRIDVEMRLVSVANSREHWRTRNRRNKIQVAVIDLQAGSAIAGVALPATVTLTRIGPRKLDDDNLRPAFKHIRDYVATKLLPPTQANQYGRRGDDSDDRIVWRYRQERGSYGIRIEVNHGRGLDQT